MKLSPHITHGLAIKAYLKLVHRIANNDWPTYDFTSTVYNGSREPLDIICSKHGNFYVRPESLNIYKGGGCPYCGNEKVGDALRYSDSEFDKIILEKHQGEITRLEGTKGSRVKINFKCNHGHVFLASPSQLQQGYGCSECSVARGFNNELPAILYYLSINSGEAFKIGITNRSIEERFPKRDLIKITPIRQWYFSKGQDAYYNEQLILKEFIKFKYNGLPLLTSGNTELFSVDILNISN